MRTFKQTQAEFEDTSAFSEVNDELTVRLQTYVHVKKTHNTLLNVRLTVRLSWRLCVVREEMTTIKHTSMK